MSYFNGIKERFRAQQVRDQLKILANPEIFI